MAQVLFAFNTTLGARNPIDNEGWRYPMKRNDWKDGMAYPDGMEDPSRYLELQLQTYAETPTPPRDDSHALLALGLLADYEIGERHERKGPPKPKFEPLVWCPGQEFDPALLELL